ncbi:hypothetical protein Golomagni_07246 [Golovinomyces magnicellulatus]|nr:hypothetical protein Golomagni_07246 [Golovinomyces magnicellulatus]
MQLSSGYQHVVITGLPYDRGLSHGQQAKQKIRASIDHYNQPGKLLPRETCLQIIKDVYIPGIEKYFPEALPELQGIADGAEVALEDIVILNARYDLARVRGQDVRPHPSQAGAGNSLSNGAKATMADDTSAAEQLEYLKELQECTAAGFLGESMANGDVILAQNWDMSANVLLKDTALYLEIHPDPSEGFPSMFVMTEAGQMGRSGGLLSAKPDSCYWCATNTISSHVSC